MVNSHTNFENHQKNILISFYIAGMGTFNIEY